MTTYSFPLMTAAGILALFAAPCPAQPPGFAPGGIGQPPFTSRPTVSPYLNLLRRGGSPALNYYTLVRPQNQFYQSLNQLQQEVGTNAQGLSALEQTTTGRTMSPTGHATGFMTQAAYFMNLGGTGLGQGLRPGQSMGTGGRGGIGSM